MWWANLVSKTVADERLQKLDRAYQEAAGERDRLRAKLQEIETSGGWRLVLWLRRQYARFLPPHSFRGRVNRLLRRALRVWLELGTVPFLRKSVRKPLRMVKHRLLRQPIPLVPAAVAMAPPPAPVNTVLSPVMTRARTGPFTSPTEPPQFAVYTSSEGNYFFHEIRDLLVAGMRELGLQVVERSEKEGFDHLMDWHVVLAPHEFFTLGAGQQLVGKEWPSNLIIINTEQPSTLWFRLASQHFPRAQALWDIDYQSAQRLNALGFDSAYLPLGYVPDFKAFRKVKDLPLHYGTCFLEPHVRQRSPYAEPLACRPIDLLFVGNLTERRQQFFTRATSVLPKYTCYIHYSDASRPVKPGINTFMDTTTVMGLVQRSKILLNIHQGQDVYFEWQRVVMQGLWQRALVISERCSPAPPFRPGIDFVEAAPEEIPDRIEYYLSSPQGVREAQIIATEGFRTLSRHCRLADLLRPLMARLNIPMPAPRVLETSLAPAGAQAA